MKGEKKEKVMLGIEGYRDCVEVCMIRRETMMCVREEENERKDEKENETVRRV